MFKRYRIRTLIITLFAPLAFIAFHGCATDIPFAPDDPITRTNPDHVLDSLRDAYERMSIESYEALLHPDYRFIFADPRKAPYGRDDDLASTGRMFSGVTGKNSAGEDAPGVASIVFNQLEMLERWRPAGLDEVDWSDETGVMRAVIRYGFVLNLKEDRRLSVSGRQIVYAVPVKTEDWDGSLYWRWQLLGQKDQ